MKKIILILTILLLLIITAITKNSTKEIEKKIYNVKENLRALEQKYKMVSLDFNYLSSPEKLMEYQAKYFENEMKEIDILNIKKLTLIKEELQIQQFISLKNE